MIRRAQDAGSEPCENHIRPQAAGPGRDRIKRVVEGPDQHRSAGAACNEAGPAAVRSGQGSLRQRHADIDQDQCKASDLYPIHISEPTRLRRTSYAVFRLKKHIQQNT